MMTIAEIEREAELAAATIDIKWDAVSSDNSATQEMFRFLDELCTLYEKLISGKSVIMPDTDSPLSYDELERNADLVAEELYAGFVLKHVWLRKNMIDRIIADSGSVDMPETPYINNPLHGKWLRNNYEDRNYED